MVNIGFEGVGTVKAYKKILSYGMAKNSLQLLTRSFAQQYKSLRFKMVSPPPIAGAAVQFPGKKGVAAEVVAKEIYEALTKE